MDRDVIDRFNRMNTTTNETGAKLGDILEEQITKHNALLTKLDADAGVTGTDYVATLAIVPLAQR